jgi:hypothetical protein
VDSWRDATACSSQRRPDWRARSAAGRRTERRPPRRDPHAEPAIAAALFVREAAPYSVIWVTRTRLKLSALHSGRAGHRWHPAGPPGSFVGHRTFGSPVYQVDMCARGLRRPTGFGRVPRGGCRGRPARCPSLFPRALANPGSGGRGGWRAVADSLAVVGSAARPDDATLWRLYVDEGLTIAAMAKRRGWRPRRCTTGWWPPGCPDGRARPPSAPMSAMSRSFGSAPGSRGDGDRRAPGL